MSDIAVSEQLLFEISDAENELQNERTLSELQIQEDQLLLLDLATNAEDNSVRLLSFFDSKSLIFAIASACDREKSNG